MANYSIDVIRHGMAHLLAHAVTRLYPDAKLGVGPATQFGFYYDFDIEQALSHEDMTNI